MRIPRTRPARWLVVGLSVSLIALSGCGGLDGARAAGPTQTSAPAASGPSSAPAATPSLTPTASTAPAAAAKHNSKPKPKAVAKPTPAAKPKPVTAMLSPGSQGGQVRELQHRLFQLDWYAGTITGTYGASTQAGVRGFQDKRGFTPSGAVDTKTWNTLTTMTRRPTDDEMHNRLRPGPPILQSGSSGDKVRELQARLKQIGWFSGPVGPTYGAVTTSAVRAFQGKRAIPVTGAVDQRTWNRLTTMTRTPSDAELHNKTAKPAKPSASGLDRRCLTGRAMCISKTSNSLVWVVDGSPRLRVDVRFGSYRTPTREGSFSVGWKSRHHVSTLYDSPMPYAMFFSGGQAVHYSSDFAARGYAGASHGCVNVRSLSGIQTLFAQVQVGDKVIVYR